MKMLYGKYENRNHPEWFITKAKVFALAHSFIMLFSNDRGFVGLNRTKVN